jgi:serine/threonine protein kinase
VPEIGETISKYKILKKLGMGGMGEVFLAMDISLGRKVALKFATREIRQDPVANRRFLREARSAATLNHANICAIYEVAEAEGHDFIVMEYVEGLTLKDRMNRGRLRLKEILQIAVSVAEALQEAHEKGIVHRDLKPANIMLKPKGQVKLMDFGVAKQLIAAAGLGVLEDTLTTLNYLATLGLYTGKNPAEQAIMRLARRLGETDLELPPDFQKTVLQYVERWRGTPRLRTALDTARQRSLPRRIRLALDQYGLPREFMFLALQESDFDTTKVGPTTPFGVAKGMWQFIPQTGAEYGLAPGPLKDLSQYDPSDQRHDENRATQAAARYLAVLYSTKAAASGLLVIACYNYGSTRIINKLDQLPNDPRQRSFWNFYRNGWIPAETRDYVMKVFSAALICEKPDIFHISMAPIDSYW